MRYYEYYAHDDGLEIIILSPTLFLKSHMVLNESNPGMCVLGERELEFGRSLLDLDLGMRFTFGVDNYERAFKIK